MEESIYIPPPLPWRIPILSKPYVMSGNKDYLDRDGNGAGGNDDECYHNANDDDVMEDGDDEEDGDDASYDRDYVEEDAGDMI